MAGPAALPGCAYAPQSVNVQAAMLCRIAQSTMLGGQASRPLGTLGSMGVPSLQIRASDAPAASVQVLDNVLSQAHRVSLLADFHCSPSPATRMQGSPLQSSDLHHCSGSIESAEWLSRCEGLTHPAPDLGKGYLVMSNIPGQ
jgi:hypothetical protein